MAKRNRTQAEVAAALGVSQPAISQNPAFVKNADGSIDANASLTIAQIREETERESLRKETALADLRQMEARERAGQLIEVRTVQEEWSKHGAILRDAMLAIPDRAAPRLVSVTAREARDILMREIRKALASVSNQIAEAA